MNELPTFTVATEQDRVWIKLPELPSSSDPAGWYRPDQPYSEPLEWYQTDDDLWEAHPYAEVVCIPWLFPLTRTQAAALLESRQARRGTYGGGTR